jgi:hypothetical protein
MNTATRSLCLHCEAAVQSQEPRLRALRLCDRCGAVRGLRRLYRRPLRWTAAWDAHIQRLVERAKLGLSVCIVDATYVIPPPPDLRRRKGRRRTPRVFRLFRIRRGPREDR